MAKLRPCRPDDLDDLVRICLLTGDAGQDASALHQDPALLGQIYAAPYAVLEPELAFAVEDEGGVAGYVLGALDTTAFEDRMERDWWPALRRLHPDPEGEPGPHWSADDHLVRQIHRPTRTPRRIARPWPSHLHIDLLPRLQGQGWGKRLIDHWLDAAAAAGSTGVHLGVAGRNARGLRFYEAYGFTELQRLPPPWDVVWFGIDPRRRP